MAPSAADVNAAISSTVAALASRKRLDNGLSIVSSVSEWLAHEIGNLEIRESIARLIVATAIIARRAEVKEAILKSVVVSHYQCVIADGIARVLSPSECATVVCRCAGTLEAPSRLALVGAKRMQTGDLAAYIDAAEAIGIDEAARDACDAVAVLLEPTERRDAARRVELLLDALRSGVDYDDEEDDVEAVRQQLVDTIMRETLRSREEICSLALKAACTVAGDAKDSTLAALRRLSSSASSERCSVLAAACVAVIVVSTRGLVDEELVPRESMVLLALGSLSSNLKAAEAALSAGALRRLKSMCSQVPRLLEVLDRAILRNPDLFDVRLFYAHDAFVTEEGRFAVDVCFLADAWATVKKQDAPRPPEALVKAAAGVFPFEPRPLLRLVTFVNKNFGGSLARLNSATVFAIASLKNGAWREAPDWEPLDDIVHWGLSARQYRCCMVDAEMRFVDCCTGQILADSNVDDLALRVLYDDFIPRGTLGKVVCRTDQDIVVRWQGIFFDVRSVATQYLDAHVDDELTVLSAAALVAVSPRELDAKRAARLAAVRRHVPALITDALSLAAACSFVLHHSEPHTCDTKVLTRVASDGDEPAAKFAIAALVNAGAVKQVAELATTDRRSLILHDHGALVQLVHFALDRALKLVEPVVLSANAAETRSIDDEAASAALLISSYAKHHAAELPPQISAKLAILMKSALGDETRSPRLAPALAAALGAIADSSTSIKIGADFFKSVTAKTFFSSCGDDDVVVFLECAASLARGAPDVAKELIASDPDAVVGAATRALRSERTANKIAALALYQEVSTIFQANTEWSQAVLKALGGEDDKSSARRFCQMLAVKAGCLRAMKSKAGAGAPHDQSDEAAEATRSAIEALLAFEPALLVDETAYDSVASKFEREFGPDRFLVEAVDERSRKLNETTSLAAAAASFFAALALSAPEAGLSPVSTLIRNESFGSLVREAAAATRSSALFVAASALELATFLSRVPPDPQVALTFVQACLPLHAHEPSLQTAALCVGIASLATRVGCPLDTRIALLRHATAQPTQPAGVALAAACLRRPAPHRLVATAARLAVPALAVSAAREDSTRNAGIALLSRCAAIDVIAKGLVDARFFSPDNLKIVAQNAVIAGLVLTTLRDDHVAWRAAINLAASSAGRALNLETSLPFFAALSMRADAWRFVSAESCLQRALQARAMVVNNAACSGRTLEQALAICRRAAAAFGVGYFQPRPEKAPYDHEEIDDAKFFLNRGVFRPNSLGNLAIKLGDEEGQDKKVSSFDTVRNSPELAGTMIASKIEEQADKAACFNARGKPPELAAAIIASILDYFGHHLKKRRDRARELDLRALLERALSSARLAEDQELLLKLRGIARPILEAPLAPAKASANAFPARGISPRSSLSVQRPSPPHGAFESLRRTSPARTKSPGGTFYAKYLDHRSSSSTSST